MQIPWNILSKAKTSIGESKIQYISKRLDIPTKLHAVCRSVLWSIGGRNHHDRTSRFASHQTIHAGEELVQSWLCLWCEYDGIGQKANATHVSTHVHTSWLPPPSLKGSLERARRASIWGNTWHGYCKAWHRAQDYLWIKIIKTIRPGCKAKCKATKQPCLIDEDYARCHLPSALEELQAFWRSALTLWHPWKLLKSRWEHEEMD